MWYIRASCHGVNAMKLWTYLLPMTQDERASFAERVEARPGHLSRVARHHRQPSRALCDRIVAATEGLVTAIELRPDFHGLPKHEPEGRDAGRPADWEERRAAAQAEKDAAVKKMRGRTARKAKRRARKAS